MQQASLSKFYSSTTTASSSASTDGADAADEEGSSTDGEQDSDGDDLHPPPAKRVDTQVRGRRPRKDHHPRSGFSSSWLKEFKWLEHVDEDGIYDGSQMQSMFSGKTPRNGKGSWCKKSTKH